MIEEPLMKQQTLWHESMTTYDQTQREIVPSGQFTSAPNINMNSNDEEKEIEMKHHYNSQQPTTETPFMTHDNRKKNDTRAMWHNDMQSRQRTRVDDMSHYKDKGTYFYMV